MAEERQYAYRDPIWVLSLLKGLIGLLLVGYAVQIVLLGLDYKLLSDMLGGTASVEAYSTLQSNAIAIGIVAIVMGVTFFAVTVAYLVWVYRACANVHALGATDLRATPGFAVGMYFIPFYNFVAPFAAMNEIYKASRNALNWKMERSSAIVAAWWAFQLITIFGNIVIQVNGRSNGSGIAGLKVVALTAMVSFTLNMIFHILQYVLVNNVSRLQVEQHRRHADHAETFA